MIISYDCFLQGGHVGNNFYKLHQTDFSPPPKNVRAAEVPLADPKHGKNHFLWHISKLPQNLAAIPVASFIYHVVYSTALLWLPSKAPQPYLFAMQ